MQRITKGRNVIYSIRCSASLITQTHILSAAHCFFDEKTGEKRENVDDLLVVLGSNDPINSGEGIERSIKNFSVHWRYIYPLAYLDVAIATLNQTIPKTAYKTIRPICLPPYDDGENDDPGYTFILQFM